MNHQYYSIGRILSVALILILGKYEKVATVT